ncbi:MAG: hypothetical protein ACHQ50_16225, partial [Fimbriimonadales bacterium]
MKSIALALGLCAVMLLSGAAAAQTKKTTKHPAPKHSVRHRATKHRAPAKKATTSVSASGAETSLANIKLLDSGLRVIAVYGSPDVIEAVTPGGSAAGPGGGAGG